MKIVFESSTAIVTYLDNGHLLHTDRTSGQLRTSRARSVLISSYRPVRGSQSGVQIELPMGKGWTRAYKEFSRPVDPIESPARAGALGRGSGSSASLGAW
jgi:hypothetical protein